MLLSHNDNVAHGGRRPMQSSPSPAPAELGEWIRYSTPDGPAEYIAVCLPAFSPDSVHRDE